MADDSAAIGLAKTIRSRETVRRLNNSYPSDYQLLKCLKLVTYSPWSCNLWNVRIAEIPHDLFETVSPKLRNAPRAFALYLDKSIKSAREADAQSLGSAVNCFLLVSEANGIDTFWMCGVRSDKVLAKRLGIDSKFQLASVLAVANKDLSKNRSVERKANISVRSLLGEQTATNYRENIFKVYAKRNKTYILSENGKRALGATGPFKSIVGNLDQELERVLISKNGRRNRLYFFINDPESRSSGDIIVMPNIFSLRGIVTEAMLWTKLWNFYDTPFYKVGYCGGASRIYFGCLIGKVKLLALDKNAAIFEVR